MRHVPVSVLVSSFLLLALAAGCSSAPPDPSTQSAALHDQGSSDPGAGDGQKGPPPVPGPCSDAVAGDGTTCQAYADLKSEAAWTCAAQGGGLTAMPVADPQGCPEGQAPSAPYTCCFPAP
jgi:hypothetical protein